MVAINSNYQWWSANYAKGKGSLFFIWLRCYHKGAYVCAVSRACGGNRQGTGVEDAVAVLMNIQLYLEIFLLSCGQVKWFHFRECFQYCVTQFAFHSVGWQLTAAPWPSTTLEWRICWWPLFSDHSHSTEAEVMPLQPPLHVPQLPSMPAIGKISALAKDIEKESEEK